MDSPASCLPSARADDSLSRLLRPASVAVIGASEDSTRIGGRPLRYLRESGFAGRVYGVNPKRTSVQGVPCFPDLASLPEAVDVALLAVPAASVVTLAQACADRGVRAIIIFSADFAEAGAAGRARQDQLEAICRTSGMRILGPNCLGAFNSAEGFYGTFSQTFERSLQQPGPIAIVSQSGAFGGHLSYLCMQRGMGVRYWVTTGNECDLGLPETLEWMVEQQEVRIILLYAEAVRDGARFVRALERARLLGKPVVMLKVGRSESGQLAAASHTGALAGKDAVYDAVLRQFGVLRARTTEEMLDVAQACLQQRFPAGQRIGIVSMSGGIGIQMADAADALGLQVAPMPESAQETIRAMIPYAGTANPVDLTANVLNDTSHVLRSLDTVITQGRYDAVILFIGSGAAASNLREPVLAALRELRTRYPDQLITLVLSGPQEVLEAYGEVDVLLCEDVDRGMAAVAALMHFGMAFAREPAWEGPVAPLDLPEIPREEYGAKQLLAQHGIPILPELRAASPDEVEAAARSLDGPVVVKILSPDIPHKTEVGGVAVGLATPADAAAAARQILGRVREMRPDAQLDGFLVAPMCKGIEVICGAVCDPTFGPVVMVGLGGVHAELFNDVSFRLAPFGLAQANAMVDELRSRPLLDGLRGAAASDVDALTRTLAALSRFIAASHAQVAEVDINPFVLRPAGHGGFALDALLVPHQAS